MKTALTIAGSDCSGGAGIQADLKTMLVHDVYGMSAIVSLVAENTMGVTAIENVSPEFLEKQLDCVFQDIFPDAVKIGMVSKKELIRVIGRKLREYKAVNIVLDPVMVSSSGRNLLDPDARQVLIEELFLLADLITPNIPEAEVLSGIKIKTEEDMLKAAREIQKLTEGGILLKGGHKDGEPKDLFFRKGKIRWFSGKRINNRNSHGTGCTLSSAIASNLAKGLSMEDSVERAKEYLTQILEAALDLGKGSGPMDHGAVIFERGKF